MLKWLGLAKKALTAPTEIRAKSDILGTDFEAVSGKKRKKLASFREYGLAYRNPIVARLFSPSTNREITKEYFEDYMGRVVHQALKDVRDKKPIPEKYDSDPLFLIENETRSRVNHATMFPAFIHYGETKILLNDNNRVIELGNLTTYFKEFDKHAPLLDRALRYRLRQTHGLPIYQIDKLFAADNEKASLRADDTAHTATIIRIQEEFARAIDLLQFQVEDTPDLAVLVPPALEARQHLIDSIEINRRGLTHLGTVSLGRIVRQAADDIPESIEHVVESARISGNTDKINEVLTMLSEFNRAIHPFLAENVNQAANDHINIHGDLAERAIDFAKRHM